MHFVLINTEVGFLLLALFLSVVCSWDDMKKTPLDGFYEADNTWFGILGLFSSSDMAPPAITLIHLPGVPILIL